MRGKIKWFNKVKGYGFILSEDEEEIFFHYTGLVDPNNREFKENDEVIYEQVITNKGKLATNVEKKEKFSVC